RRPRPPPLHTRSLHDALPICGAHPHGYALPPPPEATKLDRVRRTQAGALAVRLRERVREPHHAVGVPAMAEPVGMAELVDGFGRSEEHTSELQSRFDLVCRLL